VCQQGFGSRSEHDVPNSHQLTKFSRKSSRLAALNYVARVLHVLPHMAGSRGTQVLHWGVVWLAGTLANWGCFSAEPTSDETVGPESISSLVGAGDVLDQELVAAVGAVPSAHIRIPLAHTWANVSTTA
jgi:hypothetical protein